MGVVVYAALDYGLDSETERRLSDELIGLFELMERRFDRFSISAFRVALLKVSPNFLCCVLRTSTSYVDIQHSIDPIICQSTAA